ncbi:MAG: T9SS type A sorting domain-containing protein [Candidatus Kapabacteria bacterium]|nr:T9SS type A sorting domain-containing protein [Candidatus Kapabacteria bacterium]
MKIYLLILNLFIATNLFSQPISYTYDKLNRLTFIDYQNGTTVSYTYDELGNLTGKTIGGGPQIIAQSDNQDVCVGDMLKLFVKVSGSGLTYQWYKDGNLLSGEIKDELIRTATSNDAGTYFCKVTSTKPPMLLNSNNMIVTVSVPIVITKQPQKIISKFVGDNLSESLITSGTSPTYQWYFAGTLLTGQTGSTLTLTNLQIKDRGKYYCKITNRCGTVISDTLTLDIVTSVSENNASGYFLFDCSPNPFDESTNIKFVLQQAGQVKLTISDISGRELMVLADKLFDAGTSEIKFKTGDYNLMNGTYFYSISVNGFKDTKKMVLMK